VGSKHFDNPGRRAWWSVHVEAWQRSGMAKRRYLRAHGLDWKTFTRWLNVLTDAKMAKIRVERVAAEQRSARRKTDRRLSSDKRNRAVQAYWAMHVEALNWSGMTVREYAKALRLSSWSLGRWRDLIADEELIIDWRAQLHPSARPPISTRLSTSANMLVDESGLTNAIDGEPPVSGKPARRTFTDDEKRAIVMETLREGVTVSQVAREHRIVTSMLFRWRVQFGFTGDENAKITAVRIDDAQHDARSDGDAAVALLHDLLPVPDGMVAVELSDGRRVFAASDADPEQVCAHVAAAETRP
jgi:transposase-like protein